MNILIKDLNTITIYSDGNPISLTAYTYQVVVGDVLISDTPSASAQYLLIDNVTQNPGYSFATKDNDIAIITVDTPINLVPGVTDVICIPADKSLPTGYELNIAAWGQTTVNQDSPFNANLQNTTVLSECDSFCQIVAANTNNNLPPYNPVTQFCAQQNLKGFCNGDEGGPAFALFNGTYYQFGVISHQEGCGTTPGYYTRVANFKPWIQQTVQKCLICGDGIV